jgi:hypothetical protein
MQHAPVVYASILAKLYAESQQCRWVHMFYMSTSWLRIQYIMGLLYTIPIPPVAFLLRLLPRRRFMKPLPPAEWRRYISRPNA